MAFMYYETMWCGTLIYPTSASGAAARQAAKNQLMRLFSV
jgi:hypothetical protein